MLADLERIYLQTPDSLDDKQKKNLSHRIKNKLIEIDKNLKDIKLILENYPEERVKEHLSNDTVFIITAILKHTLQILDPLPVGEHEEGGEWAFRVWGSALPSSKPGECTIDSISRSASKEEILFHEKLKRELDKLRYFVDPCIPDPVCRNPEYIKMQEEKAMKNAREIAERTGIPLSVSLNAYFDETGVSESRWIERAPTALSIATLENMRWKPRGLKSCMELPPILEERKILTGREVLSLSIHGDEKGTQFSVSENGGEKRPITLEEFLEYQKRFYARPKSGIEAPGEDRGKEEPK